ncbi:MAG: ribose-phosphate pyrophosphokinase [Chloroflexota bacterium]|nr:ribose-phosphate pyrophosphokinase [Chloroflexota bacterium]
MPDYPLRIFSGTANRALAEEIARILKQDSLGNCTTTHLPDSEIHVKLDELVRGDDVFLIQPCPEPVNDHLMELLLYLDAFRRASVHSVTVVVPYFPYARQERMAMGREAISARVVARMMQELGAGRVVYVDIHAEAIQGFFDIPVDPLSARKVLASHFRDDPRFENAVVVSPDVGRAKLAGRFAELLRLPLALMHKRRQGFDQVRTTHVVGDIKDKIPIVLDDVIAGGSVLTQLEGLLDAGARPEMYLAITHPVLLPSALEHLDRLDYIKQLVVTNTIHVPPNKRHAKVVVKSVAPLLAETIYRIWSRRSISPLLQRPQDERVPPLLRIAQESLEDHEMMERFEGENSLESMA